MANWLPLVCISYTSNYSNTTNPTIMKKTRTLATICLMAIVTISASTQTLSNKFTESKNMKTVKQSKDVVQGFFNAFGNGDFDGIVSSFHDNCTLIAVREGNRNGSQLYGTYHGKEGATAFVSNLGNMFDTKAFSVANIIGDGNVAFANGRFTHVVKSTGASFSSDWALMCVIEGDKILEYHFYEDSEKFSEASNR